ncbi:unnamed protein product [Ilex paraguariensis]|uniref:Protein kinase domain-containing protein n=1 Tax=Ilex paraguariensis TaxID=185542 RepID=A0ABC8R1Y9_9AQUA
MLLKLYFKLLKDLRLTDELSKRTFMSGCPVSSEDGPSDVSRMNKWTCTCSSAYQGNQSLAISSNCSSSCDCSPAEAGGTQVRPQDSLSSSTSSSRAMYTHPHTPVKFHSETSLAPIVAAGASLANKWICICPANGFPKLTADGHDTSCFTACNCDSGSSSRSQSSKKRISSKVIVLVLLLCVLLTSLGFIALAVCYVYRRERCPIQRPLFSADKDTSCNSGTKLISHRASSVSESIVYLGSPDNPITGCIHKASFLFGSKAGRMQGTITHFSYSELENATNKFSETSLIGAGGSSHVYCGHLKDGRTVAIKRIKTQGGPDAESIFLTEIELLSRLHHCNVVPLLGYCSAYQGKHAERLLVFQYMPSGNLRECLDGASGICQDWGTRVAIALGAARGLEYLHEAAAPRILHRDVKSTNILLDENRRAKVNLKNLKYQKDKGQNRTDVDFQPVKPSKA